MIAGNATCQTRSFRLSLDRPQKIMAIGCDDIGGRDDKSGGKIGNAHALDDLRQPQAHAIEGHRIAEIDHAQGIDARVAQRAPQIALFCRVVLRQPGRDDGFLIAAEPCRIFGAVGQEFQNHERQQNGGRAFEQKQPLPAGKTQNAIHAENDAG